MGPYLLVIFHGCAVYGGTQLTKLEHVSVWRVLAMALLSYLVYIIAFFAGLLLVPLAAVPTFALLFLTLGTVLLGKLMLACDWKSALTIGGIAGLVHALGAFIFIGPPHV
jgi:hypothetical protein